jgi:hypothetical protein
LDSAEERFVGDVASGNTIDVPERPIPQNPV